MGNETEIKETQRIDAEGNYKCVRCGWTHTVAECAEFRLVHANKELDKLTRFLHAYPEIHAVEGETPVDTMLRTYKTIRADWIESKKAKGDTEVTDLMKEE